MSDSYKPFTIAAGDTLPALEVQLVDEDGTNPDITGLTVTFGMYDTPGGTSVSLSGSVDITADPTHGKAQFNWASDDTSGAGAGQFFGQFKVDDGSGGIKRYPNGSYIPVKITAAVV